MTSPAERIRGALALVALVALVAGVPWALIVWGGNPLPDSAPSMSWVSEPLSSHSLLAVLTVVMWCAWAHFVVCVAREFVAQRRTRGPRTRPATGHPLARRLVASVLLMAGTVTVTAQTAQAAEQHSAPTSSTSIVHEAVTSVRAVGRAAQEASDAAAAEKALARQHEIRADALHGHASGQSHRLDLRYQVKPPNAGHHDCLWDIAERYLGDGRRWTDIYELNKDRVQADGSSLQDADLIYPGWELILPDDARGADVAGVPHGQGVGGNASGAGTSAGAGASRSAAESGRPGAHGDEPAHAAAGEDAARTGDGTSPGLPNALSAEIAAAGGLIAAGLLLSLRRRRGWDGGPPRGRGTKVADEKALHLGADLPAAAIAERGLRRLTAHFAGTHAAAPTLRTARVNAHGMTVTFETMPDQDAPQGWSILGDGRVWHVLAENLPEPATSVSSAYAETVVAGMDAGDYILVNLRATGADVTVTGDARIVGDFVRALVVDLATHTWSDDLTVVTAGVPGSLRNLAPRRLIDVGSAAALASVGEQLPAGRPTVLVLGSTADAAAVDHGVAAVRQRAGALTLLRVTEETDAVLCVDRYGRLTSKALAVFGEAARLGEEAATRVLEVFENKTDTSTTAQHHAVPTIADASAAVSLHLLGPVRLDGVRPVAPERSDLVTEVLTYLALHPEGVHESVLAGAIWPRGVDADVLEATMARTQEALAPAASGRTALSREDGRWQLDLGRVHVDWHEFEAVTSEPSQSADRLADALRLVDGPPLSGLAAHRYAWLATSTVPQQMHQSIVDCARRLGEGNDPKRAEWALRTGLRAVPSCEPLWQQLLRLTVATGDALEPVIEEMYASLARHGSPLGAEATTDALVHELAPAYPVPARAGQLSA